MSRMRDFFNRLNNDKDVCRTASATPGLLNRFIGSKFTDILLNFAYWWSCIGKGLRSTELPCLNKFFLPGLGHNRVENASSKMKLYTNALFLVTTELCLCKSEALVDGYRDSV